METDTIQRIKRNRVLYRALELVSICIAVLAVRFVKPDLPLWAIVVALLAVYGPGVFLIERKFSAELKQATEKGTTSGEPIKF